MTIVSSILAGASFGGGRDSTLSGAAGAAGAPGGRAGTRARGSSAVLFTMSFFGPDGPTDAGAMAGAARAAPSAARCFARSSLRLACSSAIAAFFFARPAFHAAKPPTIFSNSAPMSLVKTNRSARA